MKEIIWLIASLIAGLLYHIAGTGGFKNAKAIRRFGCAAIALGLYIYLAGFHLGQWWVYLFTYILNALALSTYHDYLAPDGTSENWLCWLATGGGYGLSALPLVWCGVHWWAILARAIFLAISIMWLRERTCKVFKEEFFSGVLYCGSIPILLL